MIVQQPAKNQKQPANLQVSLGVKPPWKVTEVSIDSEKGQVHVFVECAPGVPSANRETRERAETKDLLAWDLDIFTPIKAAIDIPISV